MSDLSINADMFASALEDIFNDVSKVSSDALETGVRKGAQTGAKAWRAGAASKFGGSGKYASSIRSKVDRTGDKPQATVYSTMPGLPHLLEKGHATIGGGFVPGREHIAPAATEAFEAAFSATEDAIGRLGE